MTEKQTVYIIMFSRLQSYDGGRETWLNNFLLGCRNLKVDLNFSIYYFSDKLSNPDSLIEVAYVNPESFTDVQIVSPGNFFKSTIRLLSFQIKVLSKLRKTIKKNDIVLGIGNFHEAIIPFVCSFFLSKNKNVHTGIWLRSIFVKQHAAFAKSYRLKIMEAIEVKLLKPLSFVLANGWDTSDFYFDEYGIKSFVIPNALTLNKFRSIPEFDESKNNLVIAYIGRLSKEKGFSQFIESIEIFNRKYQDYIPLVEFQVVGEGPLGHMLDEKEFPNLRYLGVLSNGKIPNYLGHIDCGVALTYSGMVGGGGLSHSFLELLVSGRLVIAWNNKIFNQIKSNDAVVFIEEGNVVELADSYYAIAQNKSEYKIKTKEAMELGQQFSIENHISLFVEYIKKL